MGPRPSCHIHPALGCRSQSVPTLLAAQGPELLPVPSADKAGLIPPARGAPEPALSVQASGAHPLPLSWDRGALCLISPGPRALPLGPGAKDKRPGQAVLPCPRVSLLPPTLGSLIPYRVTPTILNRGRMRVRQKSGLLERGCVVGGVFSLEMAVCRCNTRNEGWTVTGSFREVVRVGVAFQETLLSTCYVLSLYRLRESGVPHSLLFFFF